MDSSEVRELGTFVHFLLSRELAKACEAADQQYSDELLAGFPVVGPSPDLGDGTLERQFRTCRSQNWIVGPGRFERK